MCGIVGIISYKEPVDERLLISMRDTLVHRGPDDKGIWISPDRKVGLGHRRLSIIDLSPAGHQPMSDEEGKIWIVHNGEIYNFQEIRQELEEGGYRFKSNTDTEVIIYAYKEWGIGCLQKFNGMFAFGIWDEKEKRLFLARDRVGKKPLYIVRYENKVAFASEIKAILRDRDFDRKVDLDALNCYFAYGYILDEMCIFENIQKLPPAHYAILDVRGGLKIRRYWDSSIFQFSDKKFSEEALLEELEELLTDSVRKRMISDVPLGVFLSGGLDSSLVVAFMSKVSDRPVKTFSIGFEEAKYNELPHARIIAKYFGTEHHELIVKPNAFTILPELLKQFDEPFADPSMIPTYYVSKATKDYVTVALSGDGGDELFGGYSTYADTIMNYYIAKFVPSIFRIGISSMTGIIPEKIKGKRELVRFQYDPYDAFIDRSTHRYFKKKYRVNIFNSEIVRELGDNFYEPEISRKALLLEREGDFINQVTHADFMTYLPDDILVKVDRASMKVSLEVRAPFLDYRMAEFSFKKIPGNLKVKGLTKKYLLKRLARKILPQEFNLNRKWGFAIPVSEWFKGSLNEVTRRILLEYNSDYFNKDYIKKILTEHQNGIEHGRRLYALLVFQLWFREYIV